MKLILKTHVSGYTKKDGTSVHPHEDSRRPSKWNSANEIRRRVMSETDVPLKSGSGTRTVREFSYEAKGLGFLALSTNDRIHALKIPPGWKDVVISHSASDPLQAIGTDAKGRRISIYHADHIQRAAGEKWERIKHFDAVMPTIRQAMNADRQSSNERTRAQAQALYLISRTAFRIGSSRDTKARVQAYGATTLQARHVAISGDSCRFRFVGKDGVRQDRTIHSATLAEIMREWKDGKNGKDTLSPVSGEQVRAYLHSLAPQHKIHDFRGYTACQMAYKMVTGHTTPKTIAKMKKLKKDIATKVSRVLGNTPAMALSSYINPAVWNPWETNFFSPLATKSVSVGGLTNLRDIFNVVVYRPEPGRWEDDEASEFEDEVLLHKTHVSGHPAKNDPPGLLHYSKLQRLLSLGMPNSASPGQIMWLVRDGGVSEEEIEWSGLETYIEGKSQVGKSELLELLGRNGVMQ